MGILAPYIKGTATVTKTWEYKDGRQKSVPECKVMNLYFCLD
jgi:hypothetical protein